jgi:hypothetical protein
MIRPSVLFGSLAANALLAAAVVWLLAQRPARPPIPAPAGTREASAPSVMAAALRAADAPARGHNDARSWFPALRAAGVPEPVLTQLAAANFDEQWEKRRRTMEQQWERGEIDDDAWAQFNRQHDIEQELAMRSAIGDAAFVAWHKAKLLAGLSLDRIQLSPAESDAIYDLRKDLLRQRSELDQRRRAGQIDDAQIAGLQDKLDADYEAKTKSLLGDDRYATLHHGNDTVAGSLRRNLQSLNIDAAKIDAVIAADQQWRDRRTAMDADAAHDAQFSPEAYQAKLQALAAARDAALQQQLGADGFEQLQQLQDDRYRKLNRYAELWQLTPQDVQQVYGALRNYSQSVEEYRREALNRGVNWDATQQAVDKYRESTAAALRATLGEEKYKKLTASDILEWDR